MRSRLWLPAATHMCEYAILLECGICTRIYKLLRNYGVCTPVQNYQFLCTYHVVVAVVAVVVVVVLTLTRIIKSVAARQAPVTLEVRNTPGKKQSHTKGGARTYHS